MIDNDHDDRKQYEAQMESEERGGNMNALDSLKRLRKKMTPGKWQHPGAGNVYVVIGGKGRAVSCSVSLDDATGIAACVNALPALIAAAELLEETSLYVHVPMPGISASPDISMRINTALARLWEER